MESLYNINGLMFWSEKEIILRQNMEHFFDREMKQILLEQNPAWKFFRTESPLLTPRDLINPNYSNNDVWAQDVNPEYGPLFHEYWIWLKDKENWKKLLPYFKRHVSENTFGEYEGSNEERQKLAEDDNYLFYYEEMQKLLPVPEQEILRCKGAPASCLVFELWLDFMNKKPKDLVLRPETTPGSYHYACHLLNHNLTKPPFVVWQSGKSFRREQDQVTKNMRLKEFYQQEFQCIYSGDTLNNYQDACLDSIRKMIAEQVRLPTRIVESDRLPSYSLKTMDVEMNNGDKWMEVCSVSKRIDFPIKVQFQSKNQVVEKDLLVLEVAIGLDRLVYNWNEGSKNL